MSDITLGIIGLIALVLLVIVIGGLVAGGIALVFIALGMRKKN